jgi:hypothetical protein
MLTLLLNNKNKPVEKKRLRGSFHEADKTITSGVDELLPSQEHELASADAKIWAFLSGSSNGI